MPFRAEVDLSFFLINNWKPQLMLILYLEDFLVVTHPSCYTNIQCTSCVMGSFPISYYMPACWLLLDNKLLIGNLETLSLGNSKGNGSNVSYVIFAKLNGNLWTYYTQRWWQKKTLLAKQLWSMVYLKSYIRACFCYVAKLMIVCLFIHYWRAFTQKKLIDKFVVLFLRSVASFRYLCNLIYSSCQRTSLLSVFTKNRPFRGTSNA